MTKTVPFGFLNLVAQPHPEGVYQKLLELAGAQFEGVRFFGDQFARLSPPVQSEDGFLRGRLAIWTEIDEAEPLIFKKSLEQALINDTDVNLPVGVGFNSRIFFFAFRKRDHTIIIELKNSAGQSVSPDRARRAFQAIFDAIKPDDLTEVNVFVKSERNSIEHVLGMPRLRKISIEVNLPNPDDTYDAAQRVFERLRKMGAKRDFREFTKSADAETLILDEENQSLVAVSLDVGYTKAEGVDEGGRRITRSTRDLPMIASEVLNSDESEYQRIAHLARN